ncbi:MAG: sterol-binding protein [Gammaproteobacteria bacterium]|jgi:ubiquinone biosynthesis protein UbiJ|nr:sterol-binding protein [Gammaproteobacteria bacterium]
MLKQLGLQKISQFINQALSTDPEALAELAKLQGQVLRVQVLKTPFDVCVQFHAHGISLLPDTSLPATVTLSGTPTALLRFAKTNSHTQMLMDKAIKINGDLDLLMQLKKIQERLHLDWEELLARHFGDFAANRFMLVANKIRDRLGYHARSLKMSGLDYVHHEAALLPTAAEVEEFYAGVRDLRRDIEHLEHKIKMLRKK